MKSLAKMVVMVSMIMTMAWPAAHATNVTFQVNMNIQIELGAFVVGTHQVVVRGTLNNWSGNDNLCTDGDADGIYTGTWDLTEGDHEYKYVIIGGESDQWESVANRTFALGADPVVLPVVYFNDISTGASADVEVNFRVNMQVQQLTGTFDPATDWVVVRGNHNNLGNWGGAVRLIEETGNPGVYSLWIQFTDLPQNVAMEYKFVILADGDVNQASWESSSNRSFTPTGEEPDLLPPPSGNDFGEIMPELVYFSNIGPEDIITNDLNVIFQVDAAPLFGRLEEVGYIYDVQTQDTIYAVSDLQAAGFFNNWPWGSFGQEYFMNDGGANGDLVADDTVWSVTVLFPAGSPRILIYKYGANQLDVEAGFARNHERQLDDSQPTFRMDIDCWGSPDTLYQGWACVYSGIGDENAGQVNSYSLSQNFPNPFNPSTTINFVLPRADEMTLSVFDILGREVSVMKLGVMEAGSHNVHFDGAGFASSIYFYTLSSPNFTATRKMLLMK